MERIHLTEDEKRLLVPIVKNGYGSNYLEEDFEWLYLLEQKGLIKADKSMGGSIFRTSRTDYSIAYLRFNPKLKNPTILDDKKYLINTAISALAVVISAIALYFSIK